MYYNIKTKEIRAKSEIKKLLNCSIPKNDPEKIGDFYLIHEPDTLPAFDNDTQTLERDNGVEKVGNKYVQKYVIKNINPDKIKANKLLAVHSQMDSFLRDTDYLMVADYDGTGSDNQAYMDAVKAARHTWREIRQSDELPTVEIPEVPKYSDFAK